MSDRGTSERKPWRKKCDAYRASPPPSTSVLFVLWRRTSVHLLKGDGAEFPFSTAARIAWIVACGLAIGLPPCGPSVLQVCACLVSASQGRTANGEVLRTPERPTVAPGEFAGGLVELKSTRGGAHPDRWEGAPTYDDIARLRPSGLWALTQRMARFLSQSAVFTLGSSAPTSIKFNRFLKLIFPETSHF